jgi:hypothetical protein
LAGTCINRALQQALRVSGFSSLYPLFSTLSRDPYDCYIVHQLKDGSCPPNYQSEKDILGPNAPPRFTEPDGRKEYSCMDIRAPDIIDPRRIRI